LEAVHTDLEEELAVLSALCRALEGLNGRLDLVREAVEKLGLGSGPTPGPGGSSAPPVGDAVGAEAITNAVSVASPGAAKKVRRSWRNFKLRLAVLRLTLKSWRFRRQRKQVEARIRAAVMSVFTVRCVRGL
jgi:hypothetical protein